MTTITTIRRGDLVTLPNGDVTRVTSVRGGYICTQKGTFAAFQLAPPAPDPIAAARAFLDTQAAAMRQWDNSALPSRREHDTALATIAVLLRLLTNETEDRPWLNER